MDNLTVGTILKRIKELKKEKGLTDKQISEIPVFIGDDDELNGIHTAWYAQGIEKSNPDDSEFFSMIGDRSGNVEPAKLSFLIS